ncbi:MAG: beta strand repeat-containing protein, partial [Planctomycetota bacterium]
MILSSWLAGFRKSPTRAPRGHKAPVTGPVEYVPIERPRRRLGLRPLELSPCVEVFEVRTLLTTTTFTVNTTLDTVDANIGDGMALDGSGNTSLRAAIQEANASTDQTVEIIIPAGTYNLTIPKTGMDTAEAGDLDITNANAEIVILGAGQGTTIVDAIGNGTRVFDIDVSALEVEISGLTLRGDASGDGGAVRTNSILELDSVTIENSSSMGRGGGLHVSTDASATVLNSTFTNNTADNPGGAIRSNGNLTIVGSTFNNNSSLLDGGHLAASTNGFTNIIASTLSGNGVSTNAVNGGAISVNGGEMFLDGVRITANLASSTGGGIEVKGAATVHIARSTIDVNEASATGGGIQNSTGNVTLSNTTVSGNVAATSGASAGAGIHNTTGSTLDLNHATIVNNDAFEAPGGGVSNIGGGTVIVTNTIIAGNSSAGGNFDVDGVFQSSFDNLIETVGTATGFNAGNGDTLGQSPILGPLTDNGGPTPTHEVLSGSPAIDAATAFPSSGGLPIPETDQRGVPRTIGLAPDIGAFERGFAGFIVNSTLDTNDQLPGDGNAADGAGNTTLRAAVQEVNALGSGQIVVPPGFYELSVAGDDTLDFTGAVGDLDLVSNATVIGFDPLATVIDAGGSSRVVQTAAGVVEISGVTLQNGNAGTENGGGLLNSTDTRLINLQVLNSQAVDGGGIASDFDIELHGVLVADNMATGDGGGVGLGNGSIFSSTITDNVAQGDSGGLGVDGTVEVVESTIRENVAMNDAGGIGVDLVATLNLVDSRVEVNVATNRGGGIGTQGITNVLRSVIDGNTAGTIGGGIAAEAGSLTVAAATVTGNQAVSSGGGIVIQGSGVSDAGISFTEVTNNTAASGAGIDVDLEIQESQLTISRSTIANNTATTDGAGLRLSTGSVDVDNSTIASNVATGGVGGGVLNAGGNLSLTNVTVAANSALEAGGVGSYGASRTSLANTIVATNIGTVNDPDVQSDAQFETLGFNLIGIGGFGFADEINGDQTGTSGNPLDPKLNALAFNGGQTRTMSLQAGSPALDAGNDQLATETDQRGATRQLDSQNPGNAGVIDVGAFEAGFTGFFVDTTDDTVDDNIGDGMAEDASGNTSLRAAIQEANATAGPVTIVLPAGEYSISLEGVETNLDTFSAFGDFDITTNHRLTIRGAESDITTIDGAEIDRVFHLAAGADVGISDVAIINGHADDGGGILMLNAHLDLTRTVVRNNEANFLGGGINAVAGPSTLNITDSLIEENTALAAGGIYNDQNQLNITGSLIRRNMAGNSAGIFVAQSDFTLIDSEVSENMATADEGGGIKIERRSLSPHTVTISGSRISANTASSGGGIYIEDESVTIVASEIANNVANTGDGGGIMSVNGVINIQNSLFD